MVKKILILANPNSGIERRQKIALKKLVTKLSKNGFGYKIYQKVEEIPLNNIEQSFDRLVVLGGDGTVSFAARFLYHNNINLPMAIIPVGSGNVFAQSLKISLLIWKAVKTALHGKPRKVFPCLINNQEIFVMGITTGIHADLMNTTPRWIKKIMGTVAYYLRLPLHLMKVKKHQYVLTLPNHKPLQTEASAVFILNGLPRVGGEPLNRMDPFKPVLYTLILEVAKPYEIARAVFSVFLLRKMPKKRFHYYETKSVGLETNDAPLIVDGEATNERKLSISIAPKALWFLLPK